MDLAQHPIKLDLIRLLIQDHFKISQFLFLNNMYAETR